MRLLEITIDSNGEKIIIKKKIASNLLGRLDQLAKLRINLTNILI